MSDTYTPKTFTREIDGKPVEKIAATPADAVRLEFDGWREKTTTRAATKAASTGDKPATK
jgi:hypothetical protein